MRVFVSFIIFFSREPGRRGIGCQVGIHVNWGEGGLFSFYPGIDFC